MGSELLFFRRDNANQKIAAMVKGGCFMVTVTLIYLQKLRAVHYCKHCMSMINGRVISY